MALRCGNRAVAFDYRLCPLSRHTGEDLPAPPKLITSGNLFFGAIRRISRQAANKAQC